MEEVRIFKGDFEAVAEESDFLERFNTFKKMLSVMPFTEALT